MARKEPELFYHPVVGALSPAMVGMFNFQTLFTPRHNDIPSERTDNKANSAPSPYSLPTQERKAMTLLKTASCAVTGEVLPQNRLIKFVISPENKVVPDLTGKLPGPFLWITADRQIIKKAIWRNTFASKTREAAEIPENLLEMLENNLNRTALQSLSMAKGAGELISGFTKADEALRSHQASVYVVAKDSSENGREKLERLARHQDLPVIDVWRSEEISGVLGERNANHLVLKSGGLSQIILELVAKLNAIRSEQ